MPGLKRRIGRDESRPVTLRGRHRSLPAIRSHSVLPEPLRQRLGGHHDYALPRAIWATQHRRACPSRPGYCPARTSGTSAPELPRSRSTGASALGNAMSARASCRGRAPAQPSGSGCGTIPRMPWRVPYSYAPQLLDMVSSLSPRWCHVSSTAARAACLTTRVPPGGSAYATATASSSPAVTSARAGLRRGESGRASRDRPRPWAAVPARPAGSAHHRGERSHRRPR